MLSSTTNFDTTGLLVLSVGAAWLGLVLLLGARSPRRRAVALGLTAVLAASLALAAPYVAAVSRYRLTLLVLAGASTFCFLLALPAADRLLTRIAGWASRPQLQGLALLSVGVLLLVTWPWYAEWATASSRQAPDDAANALGDRGEPETYHTLWTDTGEPVRVREFRGHKASRDDVDSEAELARFPETAVHLKRTAPADHSYNCHGWVFTGGRFVVDGADVDRILNDNGYVPVTTPGVGDVIVYRIAGVRLCHSGLVQVATDDGLVLIESKWTSMGRFLHPPEVYLPNTTRTYYRSSRTGHLLRGLDAIPSTTE